LQDVTIEGLGGNSWLSLPSLAPAMRSTAQQRQPRECASGVVRAPRHFRPVKINGRWLIDGALVNPVPVSVCRAFGARIVIAVTLSSDSVNRGSVIHDQEVLAELSMPPEEAKLPGKNGRAAIHLLHRQIFGKSDGAPGISAVMMDAINITQDRIARSRLAGDPPDVTIAPKVGGIGLFDFHRAGEAMEQGAMAAERQIDELRALVGGLVA
jgi:NTE family protein